MALGEFEHPGFLALLLALPALFLISRHSLANLPPRRARIALVLRGLLLALLAFALAGPHFLAPAREPNVIFLVDDSRSADEPARARVEAWLAEAEKARPAGRKKAVMRFARDLQIVRGFSGEAGPSSEDPRDATRITRAVRQAAALFPSGPGRIVVFSDGLETEAVTPLEDLPPGREVDAVRLPADTRPDAWVEEIVAPVQVRAAESFNARVLAGSNVPGTRAEVALFQDGFRIGQQSVTLAKGVQPVIFPNLRAAAAVSRLEATVALPEDAQPRNDRLAALVASRGEPRALLIDPEPERLDPLAEVLRGARMEAEVRPPAGFPSEMKDLRGFDLVILSDTSADSLRGEKTAVLRSWVEDFGGGLIVTGGPQSFGVGGYFRTPLEELLPVGSEHPDKLELPVAALELVLDRSGSMTAVVGAQTKMDLANQGAVQALERLQNRDYFGVMAVDVRPQTVVPLAPIGDRPAASRAIRGIRSSGGGIYVYSALLEAYRQLRTVPAKVKHVILFADAADAEEKSAAGGQSAEELAAVALGDRVTTSVVALGNEADKDAAFLRALAQAGGGRFYLTHDATALPQLFAQETLRATQPSLVE
ncbi:MAG TPA: VWA domain-containing protein, partial [Chthoniobacterales bacterium]